MIWLYRALITPVTVLILPFLAALHSKVRAGLKMRAHSPKVPRFSTSPIWIHAASGEFEYAKSVIRECKQRWPHIPIAVTYFSPTYAKSVQNFDLVDFSCPLPLDLPGPCRSLIKKLNPRVLMLARTDFWPELLHQAHLMNVPRLVFSYTQKPVRGVFKTWWTQKKLSLVDRIDCVSSSDREAIQQLGFEAHATGDTRYDQVAYRLSRPKPLNDELRPKMPTLIVGSSWSADEKVILEGLSETLKANRIKLILVPHEPTASHVQELSGRIEKADLSFALYSQGQSWDDKAVLIVDQVGILAELYTWADFAVIGGSFNGSVHSVMEALGVGLVTLVGPDHLNNREAIEFQSISCNQHPLVKSVGDAGALRDYVAEFLNDPELLRKQKESTRREFEKKLGAAAKLLNQISASVPSLGESAAAPAGGESLHP